MRTTSARGEKAKAGKPGAAAMALRWAGTAVDQLEAPNRSRAYRLTGARYALDQAKRWAWEADVYIMTPEPKTTTLACARTSGRAYLAALRAHFFPPKRDVVVGPL
jgi:hypothetical protein